MTLEEIVRDTLNRYRNDEIMLDAFVQWASNPTSMSARYGIEENYPYIAENSRKRFGLSSRQVSEYVQRLKGDCEHLLEIVEPKDKYSVSRIQTEILGQIQGRVGQEWHRGILKRIQESLSEIKKAVVLLYTLSEKGRDTHSWSDSFRGEFMAYSIAAYGSLISPISLRDAFTNIGLLNKLCYIPSKRTWERNDSYVFIPLTSLASIGLTSEILHRPDTEAYIKALSQRQDFEQLQTLHEVSEGGGFRTYHGEEPPSLVNAPGVAAKYQDNIAISPFILDQLKESLSTEIKRGVSGVLSKVDAALVSLRNELWPKCDLSYVQMEEDKTLWAWDSEKNPRLYIYLVPWLTGHNIGHGLCPHLDLRLGESTMIIARYQSLPSIEAALGKWLFSYSSGIPVSVLLASERGVQYEVVKGEEHPYANRIISSIQRTFSELPVRPPIPPITPPVPPIAPPPLPQKQIVVGSKEKPLQWGTLGTSEDRKVVIDLNAPHIIFVSGAMGAGKGYTIGVISEMLVAPSIPNISQVSKTSTIIVLYNPRDDVPSEFWSLRYPNDNQLEAKGLQEYGAAPRKLLGEEQFKVFVDPGVHSKYRDTFELEYKTNNVMPLYMDPSTLSGEDWANALATSGGSDALYIKKVFKLLRQQPPGFTLDDILKSVYESDLNEGQKGLAKARLEIMEEYLQKDDFMSKLATGGVNIFDFRKALYRPDDIFTIMTLIMSRLQNKKELASEPFVFIMNEAHLYFKGGISQEFVDTIENLIRRKRHGANWLLLDTHLPNDVDSKIIELSDMKTLHFSDKTVDSKVLKKILEGTSDKLYELNTGEAIMCANVSSEGLSKPLRVQVRPRITKHGGATKTAI
jgi:hypothetical protein